jgi:hypothetical protein
VNCKYESFDGHREERSTPVFMVFSVTCKIMSLYLVLRHMLGYTIDQQLHH